MGSFSVSPLLRREGPYLCATATPVVRLAPALLHVVLLLLLGDGPIRSARAAARQHQHGAIGAEALLLQEAYERVPQWLKSGEHLSGPGGPHDNFQELVLQLVKPGKAGETARESPAAKEAETCMLEIPRRNGTRVKHEEIFNSCGTDGETAKAARYHDLMEIGTGGHSSVYGAVDSRSGQHVAIKLVKGLSHHFQPAILEALSDTEGVAKVLDIFTCGHRIPTKFVVMELMDATLEEVLEQTTNPKITKILTKRLLRAAAGIHQAGIWHRDITIGNVMVNRNCEVKLVDMGLAIRASEFQMKVLNRELTCQIQAYWPYVPPDIQGKWAHMAIKRDYNCWDTSESYMIGICIFAIINGAPLYPDPFTYGKTWQFERMVPLFGTPAPEVLLKHYNPEPKRALNKFAPAVPPKNLQELFPSADQELVQIAKQLVSWDPTARPTAREALKDKYFLDARGLQTLVRLSRPSEN